MKALDLARNPYSRLALNIAYAVGNCVIGFISQSWWFITIGAYYTILSTTRFFVLKTKRGLEDELFVKRTTGILLVVLSFCLSGVNILAAVKDRGKVYHEIVMITIALYSFTKITIAIIGLAKSKKSVSPIKKTLRNISFADAVVSIYSLQRSMLVSFPGMSASEIQLMNILTGSGVYVIVLLLGINLIGGKKIDMAKAKIVKTTEKISENVVDGYKKIEKGVVDGYKKIEKGVVDGYTKIEDKFIDAYLTKDGETVEDAKKRLKNNDK